MHAGCAGRGGASSEADAGASSEASLGPRPWPTVGACSEASAGDGSATAFGVATADETCSEAAGPGLGSQASPRATAFDIATADETCSDAAGPGLSSQASPRATAFGVATGDETCSEAARLGFVRRRAKAGAFGVALEAGACSEAGEGDCKSLGSSSPGMALDNGDLEAMSEANAASPLDAMSLVNAASPVSAMSQVSAASPLGAVSEVSAASPLDAAASEEGIGGAARRRRGANTSRCQTWTPPTLALPGALTPLPSYAPLSCPLVLCMHHVWPHADLCPPSPAPSIGRQRSWQE